jgi:flagellar motor protein MotB
MDFLSQIKSTITENTIANLTTFLGEETSAVNSGFSLCANTFIAGLLKYAQSEIELKNLIKVLNDGGHTGDILNNFEGFTDDFEKTQLLVTIGSNISNHFLGNKGPLLIDKIAGISDVRKTSANSLLSLSAPIVLGYIGKLIKDENFDISGLRNYFKAINDNVINALPPAINNVFQFKKITYQPTSPSVGEKHLNNLNVNAKKTNWGLIIPWVILAMAGLSVLYYAKFGNNSDKPNSILTPFHKDSTAEVLRPEDFIPDPIAKQTYQKNIVPLPETSELKKDENDTFPAIIPESKKQTEVLNSEKTKQQKIKLNISKEEVALSEKSTKSSFQQKSNTQKNLNQNITPEGWDTFSLYVFKNNSAEIIHNSPVNSLISQLKNSSKTIKISPLITGNRTLSGDRAYALREMLIENGIPEYQIKISPSLTGSNTNGIVFKIQN